MKKDKLIPLMQPTLPAFKKIENDIKRIFETRMISNDEYCRKFEQKAANYLGSKYAIACPSASLGLMIVMSTLKPGTDVIMPSYTFSATYQALLWNNLNPIFVDCNKYCNIETSKLKITKNTSAVIGVHMFGNPCDIDELQKFADTNKIPLFIDAAHAFGAKYKGKKVGGFGKAEIFSLGPTKTMPVGEGCIISTNDEEFAKQVRLICNHGQRVHGNVDSAVKSVNGRLEEINAAIGVHLLDEIEEHVERRNVLARRYYEALSKIPGIEVCFPPKENRSTFKDYAIFVDKKQFGMDRNELQIYLDAKKMQSRKYFDPPTHKLEVTQGKYKDLKLPETEKRASTTLSLPFYSHMDFSEIDAVCKAIKDAHESAN